MAVRIARMVGSVLCLSALAVWPAPASEPGTIVTIAGTPDVHNYAGDGGPATQAVLFYPHDVEIAANGDVYISDTQNYRIRKVDPATGIISTVVGTGEPGYAGDGGPAGEAELLMPRGLDFDDAGNLYFADTNNNVVRRVDAITGIITTVAGSGGRGFDGDGGPARKALFYAPYEVLVVPNGDLLVSDTVNNRVRRVNAATGIITTIVGNGATGFFGDGGPATEAGLNRPTALVLDDAGTLYIADSTNDRVRRVDPSGVITTVAGNGLPTKDAGIALGFLPGGWPGELVGDGGPATEATLSGPHGLALDDQGRLIISDAGNLRIRRIEASGVIRTVAGSGERGYGGDGGPAVSAELHVPFGITLDADGNLYLAQSGSHVIRKLFPPLDPAPAWP